MCATCGCGEDATPRVYALDVPSAQGHDHPHDHGHDHTHAHSHDPGHAHTHPHDHGHDHTHNHGNLHAPELIPLEQNLLAKNDLLAERNRGWLAGRKVRALNMMSSPGAGKTTLLVRTLTELGDRLQAGVIEGDQETSLDADRIQAAGRPVVQINTGAGCHLDADMLRRGLDALDPPMGSTVFIENVGNLVCPALFDLGEAAKVVIVSVTEGDDKPQKYPHMFIAADLVIINKSDLLPYVEFDVDECVRRIRHLNAHAEFLVLSATTGDGVAAWYDWLDGRPSRTATRAGSSTGPLEESLTDAH
ncbi:hydrogenase nickel incorporation protein HypB [Pseudarthrobacter sulfonivorans]|uniref:hydrogenase nickel incorporation protein HypB n=1 Tax=Pseudarthrobacter sulfonivorans TaxID=121292 RepID=UPI0028611224|nr:hydrogenase nickel incorporation protein HypB [Pseudarthrobacter sulfonivorans]MDR6414175.1 hydrogenase nickel incorporation protein HypB [Pseudarthrobacter sulfonivorans]